MKRSLKELLNYQVETKDLQHSKAVDFLFDEKLWFIRYLKVEFGSLLSSEKYIIPKVFLKKPDWNKHLFPIEIEISEIDKCPKIEEHLPVSRKYEEKVYQHYKIEPYWFADIHIPPSLGYYPPRPIRAPLPEEENGDDDSILRSFNEVEGYHIEAIDGRFGHVEDLIIEDSNWQIAYAVIDTRNWFPWSKKVLLAIDWFSSISYEKKVVRIDLYSDKIKDAPAYKPTDIIDEDYEKGMYDFYSQSLVK